MARNTPDPERAEPLTHTVILWEGTESFGRWKKTEAMTRQDANIHCTTLLFEGMNARVIAIEVLLMEGIPIPRDMQDDPKNWKPCEDGRNFVRIAE